MAQTVILGAGLGGLPMAFHMKALARPGDTVTVVSETPRFHYVPSNPWVAVRWRSRQEVELDLPAVLNHRGIACVVQRAQGVQPDEQRLLLANGQTLAYDHLVIATGPQPAFDEVEGLGPFVGYTQSVCHIEHAVRAAQAWQGLLAAPGPVVVGAVQGASGFGQAYEFAMLLDADLRRRRLRHKAPITFVTPEPYIGHLGLGGVGDSRLQLEAALRERGIGWLCNVQTARIRPDRLYLTERGERGQRLRQHILPFRFAMLMPAFRGLDPTFGPEGLTDERGFVRVDAHQRNPRFPNVFGVGGCVSVPQVEATPIRCVAPVTGCMVESMAQAAARNIRDLQEGRAATHSPSGHSVCLAHFGNTGAAYLADRYQRPRGLSWYGKGKWVNLAKQAVEHNFLDQMCRGSFATLFEHLYTDFRAIARQA